MDIDLLVMLLGRLKILADKKGQDVGDLLTALIEEAEEDYESRSEDEETG